MSRRAECRELGMDRRIQRRDFINGMAAGIVGAYGALRADAILARQAPAAPAATPYPPARLGLRGQHPSAVEAFDRIKAGVFANFPGIDVDTQERYDLVIVGGGLSGLAAAYF